MKKQTAAASAAAAAPEEQQPRDADLALARTPQSLKRPASASQPAAGDVAAESTKQQLLDTKLRGSWTRRLHLPSGAGSSQAVHGFFGCAAVSAITAQAHGAYVGNPQRGALAAEQHWSGVSHLAQTMDAPIDLQTMCMLFPFRLGSNQRV